VKYKNLFRTKSIAHILNEVKISEEKGERLERSLTLRDLTSFGIAAIIGAGIFGTIGTAAANGGPGVSLLFVFTAIACLFSALCYAQFASGIPIAGSAYTYAYTSFGELIAWIIGWDLLMEYAIGNVTVAISWSDYFTSFLQGFNIHLPEYLTMDYLSASRAMNDFASYKNLPVDQIPANILEGFNAWSKAPSLGSIRFIADVPALTINILITWLVYIGIKESKRTGNTLVVLKLLIIFLVITAGAFFVTPSNWHPFAPNGLSGILKGVSAVFFAYIGFDAISTTAEEAKDPQKDLPKAMIYSLIVCTILYVVITFILTGMVQYSELAVGDPLAYVFQKSGLDFLSGIVAAGAIIAMTSVLLVFQLGQPRIWMSMSRDGLLPKIFSRIHPKFRTPFFATIMTGVAVGLPVLFFNLQEVTDLTSIGTLFAFVLVCGGILIKPPVSEKGFKIPYVNSKFIVPLLFIGAWVIAFLFFKEEIKSFFNYESWEIFKHKIPFLLYIAAALAISVLSYLKNLSLIPVLGLLTNLYLMSELGITNWMRFLLWLMIGLVIYFLYGYRRSKLNASSV
jgi:basic amino acid/polyamine antiporter, APA family